MEQIRLATGHRTEKPYRPEKMAARVYSPEELCYLITLEAYMLDESFVSSDLADWLENECGLDELADRLRGVIRKRGAVEEFAREILEYIGFYPEDRINDTCEIIRDNSSLSIYEKNKSRADYYLMCGHVSMALSAYNELLESIPEKEVRVRASIWHNCGYAYARMFRFSEAAKAFYCAYKTQQDENSLKQFLTALRLSREDRSYLEYVSEHPEFYEMSQKVERSIGQAAGAYEGTDEHRMILAMQVLREDSTSDDVRSSPYYERLEEILDELKASYRDTVTVQ
ncbi:MAG: hypothetical protein IJ058_07685 [Lachnospiraceae bacterium]|nr:hypothetical protein [Lachnospiraceae bacterium]